MTLFEHNSRKELLSGSPLSSRLRPESLDEFIGQEHILGEGKILRNLIENKSNVPFKVDYVDGILGTTRYR